MDLLTMVKGDGDVMIYRYMVILELISWFWNLGVTFYE